jgi:hypothetical protein
MLLLHENDPSKWRAIRLLLKIAIILVSRLSVSVSVATQCDYKTQVSDRPHGVRARLQRSDDPDSRSDDTNQKGPLKRIRQ